MNAISSTNVMSNKDVTLMAAVGLLTARRRRMEPTSLLQDRKFQTCFGRQPAATNPNRPEPGTLLASPQEVLLEDVAQLVGEGIHLAAEMGNGPGQMVVHDRGR